MTKRQHSNLTFSLSGALFTTCLEFFCDKKARENRTNQVTPSKWGGNKRVALCSIGFLSSCMWAWTKRSKCQGQPAAPGGPLPRWLTGDNYPHTGKLPSLPLRHRDKINQSTCQTWVCLPATFLFLVFHDSPSDLFICVNFESNSLTLGKAWDLLFRGERALEQREPFVVVFSLCLLPPMGITPTFIIFQPEYLRSAGREEGSVIEMLGNVSLQSPVNFETYVWKKCWYGAFGLIFHKLFCILKNFKKCKKEDRIFKKG